MDGTGIGGSIRLEASKHRIHDLSWAWERGVRLFVLCYHILTLWPMSSLDSGGMFAVDFDEDSRNSRKSQY